MRHAATFAMAGLLATVLSTVPSSAQQLCGRDSIEVTIDVRATGFGSEARDRAEENHWRPLLSRLIERCPRCPRRGNLDMISGAIRKDSSFQAAFPEPVQFEPKDSTRLRPLGASVLLTVEDLSSRSDEDRISIRIAWQWTQGRYGLVEPPARPASGRARRNRARLLERAIDDLRRQPGWECLISRNQDTRRGLSVVSRVGLWTGEVLTEEDLGDREDLRMQHATLGVQIQSPLLSSVDLRGRLEGGAVWLYTSESGGPVVSNGNLQPGPTPSVTLHGALVWYPFTRGFPATAYVLAGADVLYMFKGASKLEQQGWAPEVAYPGVPALGGTLGLGITAPVRVEITARWARPKVLFLGHSRQPTVLDISTSINLLQL